MPLTHFDIQNAKPADKPFKLSDGGGLFLLVQPNGSKLWRLKYRFLGKERSLSFGAYPDGLAGRCARRSATKPRSSSATASIPSVQKKLDRLAARDGRPQHLRPHRRGILVEPRSQRRGRDHRRQRTAGSWKIWPRRSPTAPSPRSPPAELLDLLKRVEKSGRRETARRMRGVIGSVFRLAVVTLRATSDPTYALQGRAAAAEREAARRDHRREDSSAASCARSTNSTDGRRSRPR